MGDFNGGSLRRGEALMIVSEVTSEWLAKQGACRVQLDRFVEVFGLSARIDSVNFRLAVFHGFDLDWLARRVFSGNTLISYKLMWARAEKHRDQTISNAWKTLHDVATSPVCSVEGFEAAYRVYEDVRAAENRLFKSTWLSFYKKLGFH